MAYHEVSVKPSDVEKIAFITQVVLCKIIKMLFGLCTAPLTNNRLISQVLQSLICRICLAYLNNIIVLSKMKANHSADINAVLDIIRFAWFNSKPTKCSLYRN